MQIDNLNSDLNDQEDIILDVLLAIMIGDWTGSNIENFVGGNQYLLKWDLYHVTMLPPAGPKSQQNYNLNLAQGCSEDDGAKKAKDYILKTSNRLTDDTMFSMALALTFIVNRKKYKLDQEFDEKTYKKNLEELMADYTEMLIKFYNYYRSISICGPMMHELLGKKLANVPKNKLVETIEQLKKQNKSNNTHYCESYANGSAMHSAPGAYVARNMKELNFIIEQTVKNTHDNLDAIKGAKVVAQFIFLARLGLSKETIAKYIDYEFKDESEHPCASYNTKLTLEKIKETYFRTLECKYTVTPALIAVLTANSFEEAVNNARSIAGDCDTICAIAAQMAVALWPIPKEHKKTIKEYSRDVETTGTLKLDTKNPIAEEFLSCNKNGKNNLFITLNDKFNEIYVLRNKNNNLTLWQLKNILSIIEDSETNLKNIATEGKKNDLIALLDGIEKDLQNKFDKRAENDISGEINELLEKIKSKTATVKDQAREIVIFVSYIVVLKNVFLHKLNLAVIFICVLAAIICAIKALWLFSGISAGIFLLIIMIDFVASIIKFRCINRAYYLWQNNIYHNHKTLELPPNTIKGQHLKINLDQAYEKNDI